MINRVGLQAIKGPQFQQQAQGFQGISPAFFGPPNQMDKMKDMHLSKSLGIDTTGMERDDIKANILSKLTGQSVADMKTFFTSFSEADMKKDMQQMQSLGLEASSNPDWAKARGENKAAIVNAMIQANGTQVIEEKSQTTQANSGTQQTQKSGGKGQGPPPISDSLLSFLQSLGLSPSGSKEGDYAAVMSKLSSMEAEAKSSGSEGNGNDAKLQSIDAMRQSFMAIYASL